MMTLVELLLFLCSVLLFRSQQHVLLMQGNFGYSSTTRLDFEAAALLMSKPFGPLDLSSIQDHQHNRANLVSKLVTQGDGKLYSKEPGSSMKHTRPLCDLLTLLFIYHLAHELLRQMERNAKTYVIHEKKVIITHLISRDYFKDLSSLVQRYMDSVRITLRFLLYNSMIIKILILQENLHGAFFVIATMGDKGSVTIIARSRAKTGKYRLLIRLI